MWHYRSAESYGHQRVRAARDNDLEHVPAVVQTFPDEAAEILCLVMNNTQRRQLSREEMERVIGYWLKNFTDHANNWIGQDLGVDHKTVEKTRQKLESKWDIPTLDRLKTRDGRTYPRKVTRPAPVQKPAPAPIPATPTPQPAPQVAPAPAAPAPVQQPEPAAAIPVQTLKSSPSFRGSRPVRDATA